MEKLRILHNFRKRGQPPRYNQVFEKFCLEMSVPFDFHPGISEIFGSVVRFSKLRQFPDFLNLSQEITVPFVENFEMESAQCFEKQRTTHVHYNETTSEEVCGDFFSVPKLVRSEILISELSICFCNCPL